MSTTDANAAVPNLLAARRAMRRLFAIRRVNDELERKPGNHSMDPDVRAYDASGSSIFFTIGLLLP